MPRSLAILLSAWQTDRVRLRLRQRWQREVTTGALRDVGGDHAQAARELALLPHRPILITAEISGATRIVAVCGIALSNGVRCGMSLAHGRALCHGLAIESPQDEVADRTALRSLARWCQRWSPGVAIDDGSGGVGDAAAQHPPALILDATGVAHLMKGEEQMVRRVHRAFREKGIRARVAMAPTPRAALVACASGVAVVGGNSVFDDTSAVRMQLATCPVESLRLEARTIEALHEVNLRLIGDLHALPRADLLERFGPELLLVLDYLDGTRKQRLDPVREAPPIEERVDMPSPDPRQETLWRALDLALDALCAQLQRRHRRMREIEVVIDRYRMPAAVMRLSMNGRTDDPRHVAKLLRPRLERLDLGHGMESMTLRALRLAKSRDGLWLGEGREALVDILGARLGRDGVRRILPLNRHAPDRAWRTVPADRQEDGVHRCVDHGHGSAAIRPTSMLPRPDAVTVLVRAARPTSFHWRGREVPLTRALGPERLAEEWWMRPRGRDAAASATAARDLWRVQADDGAWFLLERRGSANAAASAWSLRGAWS